MILVCESLCVSVYRPSVGGRELLAVSRQRNTNVINVTHTHVMFDFIVMKLTDENIPWIITR